MRAGVITFRNTGTMTASGYIVGGKKGCCETAGLPSSPTIELVRRLKP